MQFFLLLQLLILSPWTSGTQTLSPPPEGLAGEALQVIGCFGWGVGLRVAVQSVGVAGTTSLIGMKSIFSFGKNNNRSVIVE